MTTRWRTRSCRALAAAGQTLGTIEIGTGGRVAACLAQAAAAAGTGIRDAYRGGTVLAGPTSPATDVPTLAERARTTFNASLGLAVGSPRPGPEGRSVLDVALTDGRRVERLEHMLGGGPSLAPSRAAKFALDLVRRSQEGRNTSS